MGITRVDYDFKLRVQKTIEVGVSGAEDPTANVETATKVKGYLDTGSSPGAQKEWVSSRTITSTSEALNLMALTYGNLPTVSTTGYKVQFFKFVGGANNTTDILISPSTANGYSLFGTTAPVSLKIGGCILGYGNNKLTAVSSDACMITVTATTSGQAYEVQIVAG